MSFSVELKPVTCGFPKHEFCNMFSQIMRATDSIVENCAKKPIVQ